MASALFFIFAGIAIVSALLMILHPRPVYCALFLLLTMFALAGLYVLLSAPFIAAIHVIVYAGAVMVLFLFVLMLLESAGSAGREIRKGWQQLLALTAGGVLFVELAFFVHRGLNTGATVDAQSIGDTVTIGTALFTRYLFPFEAASVLLLSAIIGAVLLAKSKLRT